TGVSGSGKTTIATMLARRLAWPFKEGEDPDIAKAHSRHPLDDRERWPWLEKVAGWIDDWRRAGTCGVITCSALKRSYRDFLTAGRPEVRIVYLQGDRGTISARLAAGYEPLTLGAVLDHQFAILEEPDPDEYPIRINVSRLVEEIVAEIVHELGRPVPESRSPVVE